MEAIWGMLVAHWSRLTAQGKGVIRLQVASRSSIPNGHRFMNTESQLVGGSGSFAGFQFSSAGKHCSRKAVVFCD